MSESTHTKSGASRGRAIRDALVIQLQELRRRNPSALGMDTLYLITTSFFTVLATKAWDTIDLAVPLIGLSLGTVPFSWPLAIAAIPLLGLLYFGLRSSIAFFLSQIGVIVLTLLAVRVGLIPF